MTKRRDLWFVFAIVSGGLTLCAVTIGVWQLLCGKQVEAANWVMAAGGLALVAFASVQLHREVHREAERQAAARAKLKPAARLARRMCEQGVIESDGKALNQWLGRWHTVGARSHPIDVLEERLRETVTLAAEAGDDDFRAADSALDSFIAAADIINDMARTLTGAQEDRVLMAANPRGRRAADHLAAAAAALARLSPRGTDEPALPAAPKFSYEK